jgi:probable phosphoglycerate mutase
VTTIILVRHGQTEWNRIERFRGRVDLELNPAGVDQACKTAIRIQKSWKPDSIYSSPLKRAIQTANAIAELSRNQVKPVSELIDIDYGEWQGFTPEEARLRWPDQIEAWYHHPEKAIIPGGENLSQVQNRAIAFIHFWRLRQDPCAINIIEVNDNKFTLVGMNDTCHLE